MAWTSSGTQGFSVLLKVVDTPEDMDEEETLQDATTLLAGRWGLDFEYSVIKDEHYAFASCSRFTVSEQTIGNALGDMVPGYIEIYKGPASCSFSQAVRFLACKTKWNVPANVSAQSEDTSGQGPPAWKKKRLA